MDFLKYLKNMKKIYINNLKKGLTFLNLCGILLV